MKASSVRSEVVFRNLGQVTPSLSWNYPGSSLTASRFNTVNTRREELVLTYQYPQEHFLHCPSLIYALWMNIGVSIHVLHSATRTARNHVLQETLLHAMGNQRCSCGTIHSPKCNMIKRLHCQMVTRVKPLPYNFREFCTKFG